jgi:ATP-dependent DNA helicase PIF1
MLSDAQQYALDRCLAGKNLFITGGAGVGKSHLTSLIVRTLRDRGLRVRVTASTGAAASLINGQTLHSLLGLGLADKPVDVLVSLAMKRRKLLHVWRSLDVLLIDEVSMLDPDFFTKVDLVVSEMRGSRDPFGGLQVILVGDFFQLPPVRPRSAAIKFAFETDTWARLVDECVELTHIFRQEDTSVFADILRKVRKAELELDDIQTLFHRVNADPDHVEGVIPTQLYSRRKDVHDLNTKHLSALDALSSNTYTHTLATTLPEGVQGAPAVAALAKFAADTLKNMQPTATLELREGAQVMMLINQPESRLVNGSRGVVVRFEEGDPVVRFKHTTTTIGRHAWTYERDGVGCVAVTQIPLQLAWASTVHKSQGATLDCAEISLDSSVFEYGQAYVALSRVRSLEGVRLVKFNHRVIRADPRVKSFYENMNKQE